MKKNLVEEMILEFWKEELFDIQKANKAKMGQSSEWLNKPVGGVWTSPEGSGLSWKQFIDVNSILKKDVVVKSKLKLKPGAQVYVLDSWDDFYDLPTKRSGYANGAVVNWDILMEQGYVAFWLTENAAREFHFQAPGYYEDFNTWDVETVVVLDPDWVEEIV